MSDRPMWTASTIPWLAGIAVAAGGLAGCVTLLNLGGRAIMELGGFVATGGPYAIEHPAPDWVLLIPGSVLAGFAFGGLSVYISTRTGGINLLPWVWSGLFLSLGAQFAIMGLRPPGGQGPAWGWIVCAVVFIPMGLAPIVGLARGLVGGSRQPSASRPWDDRLYRFIYLAFVVAGGIGGVIAAAAWFRTLAG